MYRCMFYVLLFLRGMSRNLKFFLFARLAQPVQENSFLQGIYLKNHGTNRTPSYCSIYLYINNIIIYLFINTSPYEITASSTTQNVLTLRIFLEHSQNFQNSMELVDKQPFQRHTSSFNHEDFNHDFKQTPPPQTPNTLRQH
jgi:hypothetical protein